MAEGKSIERSKRAANTLDTAYTRTEQTTDTTLPESSSSQNKKARVDNGAKKTRDETELEMLVFGANGDDFSTSISKALGTGNRKAKRVAPAPQHEEGDSDSDSEDRYGIAAAGEEEASGSSSESDGGESDGPDHNADSLFFVDTARDGAAEASEEEASEEEASDESESGAGSDADSDAKGPSMPKAVWVDESTQRVSVSLTANRRVRKLREDEEDELVGGDEYEARLRKQFEKINPVPKWASAGAGEKDTWASSDAEEAGDRIGDELLTTSRSMLSRSGAALLPSGIIRIHSVRNGNQQSPSQSVLNALEFHPTANVMLTAGMDKTLRLFEVDGKTNQKIQSLHFKDLPITTAQFVCGGQEVVVSGRRKWYYSVDVERASVTRISGIPGHKIHSFEHMHSTPHSDKIAVMTNSGQIHMLSSRTKQWMSTLPMNGAVRNVSFTADGNYLWSIGADSEVYQWDLRQNRCVDRWRDQTSFKPTAIALSRDSTYFASGDVSGVVNLYDTSSGNAANDADAHGPSGSRRLVKSIANLTTAVSGLKFNHSSEMLGVFSRKKPNQFRVVHLPTATVFSNWPQAQTKIGYAQCFDFSPNSGFLAIGSDTGKALLYRLSHYSTY